MRRKKLFVCVIVAVALALVSAVPRSFNYQGKLVDASGVGVNDTIPLTFRLYTSETGGAPLWEQTIPDVIVRQGLFSVELAGFPDSVDFSNQYWLEVEAGGEVFSPREKLTASPYSIRSSEVEQAIQAVNTRSNPLLRRGIMRFEADSGAVLEDGGDTITVRFLGAGAPSAPSADFELKINQASISVYRGSSITNEIGVILLTPSASVDVALSIIGLPSGATATFSPNHCSPTCQSVLTISTTNTTIPGTYTVTVIGTSAEITRTATFTLTVNIPFDYTIVVDPVSRTIDQGSQTSTVVSANLITGFPENVTFSVSGLPSGCMATFSPTSCILSCSSTLTINTSITTPPGTYPCQITAMTSGGVVRTTTFTLIVRYFNFTLSLSQSSGQIPRTGGPITSTVSLTRVSEVSQTVSLSAESVPESVSVSFSPTGCNPTCSATMSITTSGATSGVYGIDVIGTGVGGGADTATYTLTVCALPGAPRNLTVTGGIAQVVLNWEAPSSDSGCAITNYRIYRSTAPNPTTLLRTVGNVLTYTDSSVTGGTTYYYRVTAVNAEGEGGYSNEVSATACAHGSQTFSYTGGLQTFTAVCSGTYTIEAWGAQGGSQPQQTGGYGARMRGDCYLTAGTTLRILVGGQGANGNSDDGCGGGGGSFVVKVDSSSSYQMYDGTRVSPLVIAGGGGGAGADQNGIGGTTNECSTSNGDGSVGGSCSGNGGGANDGSGGGGFIGNGANSGCCSGGRSFLNGGAGGSGLWNGGYGGGGAGSTSTEGAGGGGGYSGGPGGSGGADGGGGGGSYCACSNCNGTSATRTGNGQVTISW